MTTAESPTAVAPVGIPADFAQLVEWSRWHRAHRPVFYDEQQRCWQVFRYEDLSAILGDPGRYLADLGDLLPSNPDLDLIRKGNFVNMDGARHRKLRGLVAQAFTPRVVAALEPRVVSLATELLDSAESDRFDLVSQLAYPLPVIVIAELLGIPAADRVHFRRWAEEFFPFDEKEPDIVGTQDAIDTLAPTVREMTAYLLAHIADRRRRPREDLTSRLVQAEVDGERLADDEMVGLIALLLTAGHITTAALLGNTVHTLDRRPAVTARLRADRAAVPGAIDEVLRFRPPLPRLTRRTATEVTLGGQTVPAGEVVALWLVSGNRDEAKFAEPDTFDIDRRPNQHLGFGHGIHFCLGAPLARLENRVALNLLFDRYREINLVGAGEFHHPFAINSAKSLPLRVVPA
ncbi:cytochrome P450 [Couchioplanes azureus]|uniref:cytochrome P450 n=1 Tax=Couchioplanes caeruleus TaxID=56438 RepID=UPI00166F7AFF|nr:cytochrome P450 [Couchioplanes caeruleus]GGQ86037.1 cytochrome P450 [Couchioplanes caeruleus subsp. azureus]